MKKLVKLLSDTFTSRDLKNYKMAKEEKRKQYQPSSNPADLGQGFKILDETIVDLNISTTKYSRVLTCLTFVLLILTLVLLFK
ncbi:MAG: hypothetical protein A4E56_03474 [Pelotomaculum sp. PtaU1.Bin065]|jgi:hypothetical protein|nr:MAG: hypothetical protein A4E56_03474 [Pelotomaculum sp. PtaU1.Bin065]